MSPQLLVYSVTSMDETFDLEDEESKHEISQYLTDVMDPIYFRIVCVF